MRSELDDMDERKRRTMRQIREVEKFLREWDPIGVTDDLVADGLPPDEYDNYAPHIVGLLQRGETVEDLAAHLRYCRTGAMGLVEDDASDIAVATKILEWWRQEERAERNVV